MKKCPVCGLPNADDAKFCEGCGNQFEDDRDIFGEYKSLKKDAVDILLDGRKKTIRMGVRGLTARSNKPAARPQKPMTI